MQHFCDTCYLKLHILLITKTRLRKVIWEQATSPPLMAADPLTVAVHNRSTVFARWRQCALLSNTEFLTLTHSQSQMAAGSVQPLLHGWYHILPIRYIVLPMPPNLPLRWVSKHPSDTWFLGPTLPTTPNNTSIELAVFPQYTLVTNQQSDRIKTEPDL